MDPFWDSIIKPLFELLRPHEIVEIGADYGHNTRNILTYCKKTDSRAHIIDPQPKFDPEAFQKEYGDHFIFYRSLSLNALPMIDHIDAVLIDGDHNWYTVYHELKLIEQKCQKNGVSFPLVLVHDVTWPYGRRDMYYSPKNIPEAFRMPYAQKGLDPDSADLVEKGGLNPHLCNAVCEHSPKNGVLSAVEDFIQESGQPLGLITIPVFYGLGILYPSSFKETHPLFVDFIQQLSAPGVVSQLLAAVEKSRIKFVVADEENRQKLWDMEATRRQAAEKAEQLFESMSKKRLEIKKLKAELEENVTIFKAFEEKRQIENQSFTHQVKQQQQKIQSLEQKTQSLEQTKNKLTRERDQLYQWVSKLQKQFNALMQSNRWWVGHGLISLLTLSMFKKNFTMATDHIKRIFNQVDYLRSNAARLSPKQGNQHQNQIIPKKPTEKGRLANGGIDIVMFWKQNDTGLYGRRSDMFIQYLSRRQKIRKIVVFDMPVLIESLRDKAKQTGINHDRLIYRETLLRNWGMRDTDKISFHTFIYQTGTGEMGRQVWRFPDKSNYMSFIEERLNEAGIKPEDAVFWFYPENSYITKIVKRFKPRLKVVDLVDDHRTWLEKSEMKWFYLTKYYMKRLYLTKHYKEVLKTADLVFANCQNVKQSMQKYHHGIRLIPNGCELVPPPDFSRDGRFKRFESSGGPKLGYVGNLEKGKIDAELIKYLAEHRPDWHIFLIGSTHANPDILKLDEYSNIHFMGVVQYPDVRAWIKAFDVAILPHLNSEKTRSMNPLKLYVYCSLGVPVVATDIENLDELRFFVSIADGYDDFIKKVELSLKNRGRNISTSLKDCLLKNTWDIRVDQVLSEIDAML